MRGLRSALSLSLVSIPLWLALGACGDPSLRRDLSELDRAHQASQNELRSSIADLERENEALRDRVALLEGRGSMSAEAPAPFDASPMGALCAAIVRREVLLARYGASHPAVVADEAWLTAARSAIETRRAAGEAVPSEPVLAAMLIELDRVRERELELATHYGAAHPDRIAAATERAALEAAVEHLRDHGSCEP